ncbi:MAG: slipin family protein [Rhodospirillales bacterium]|nr:slipin family protein [Rhodospirillales bacterium]MDH3792259.1 slipin family protein [Rhodospirillales bacterium]MDH3911608.1 slipin family protein [Rhodospirillales bacterium]MDH3919647.1 slipin family protein [Rhodospirillales bacterium]MDH3968733.1 slipin family protein [Rhodospirillales bacterium]
MDLAAILALAGITLAIGVPALALLALLRRFKRFVVQDHQWGLLYRDGRFQKHLEPGAYRRLSPPHQVVTFDKRRSLEIVAGQEVLTGDNIGLKLSLVAEYRVVDPLKVRSEVQSIDQQLHHTIQVAARKAAAKRPLDELLADREPIAAEVHEEIAQSLAVVGLEVLAVSLRDFMLSKELRAAYAAVPTARKEGEAALERARGEQAALRNLSNAARMLKDNPDLLQLRVLQTMAQSDGVARTFVLGVPSGSFDLSAPQAAADRSK